ncbi:hypothetical protein [Streptomyces sp. NPDC050560]|uniref:hypothetical protein n=1 Tax=Streptomyces sp. NPDC050560 TaxID=3365630 RepID=UPI0037B13A05
MEILACPETPDQEPGDVTARVLAAARVQRLERSLSALPALYEESLHNIAPVSRQTNHTRVSGTRSGDSLNLSALDARHDIVAVLESWAEFVSDEVGGAAPRGSVPHLVTFLLRHLAWLTEQPPAADFADEVEDLRKQMLHTVDPTTTEFHRRSWDCVVAGCTGKITTAPRPSDGAGVRGIRCSSGHTWETHEWITLRPLVERRQKTADA